MCASEGFTMGPHIDAFCGEICLKLVDIDEELRYLKITIREKARHAAPEVRSRLEKVMKRIACNQPKVAAARAQVEHWIKDRAKDALRFRNEEIPEDRIRKLRRAAEADRYAAACIDLAIAAVDEAERAALEAWLVREGANSNRCEPQRSWAMA
jgi:DNA-nicking Smr family endonuclease